jgi:hypothetical protein
MGSSVSKDNNTSKLFNSQNESYYDNELRSQNLNNKNQSTNNQSETAENSKIIEPKVQKVPFKFEWKEGGGNVEIAASFLDNWKKQVEMKKNLNTGFFEVTLDVPKGIQQFKFIVDNIWVYSPNYSIINDKNNINNIIDFTNYPPNNANDMNKSTAKKKKKKSIRETIEYNCNFPKPTEVNSEAPGIPQHYLSCFDLNYQTKQDNLKSIFHGKLIIDKRKNLIENNTFKDIVTIYHDKLCHICYNIRNKENNEKDNYIRTAITQRIKHKFLTIVYFTPKSKE